MGSSRGRCIKTISIRKNVSEVSVGERKVTVEIKSVNHRFLEAGIKLPKKLNYLDAINSNEEYYDKIDYYTFKYVKSSDKFLINRLFLLIDQNLCKSANLE